jgi:hypothetical protein
MNNTINRIIQLLPALKMSARQFDLSIGTGNSYTLRMQKNNASVGSNVIERIAKVYPQINLVWLITGQDKMFVKNLLKPEVRTKAEIQYYIDNKLNLNEILVELDKAT